MNNERFFIDGRWVEPIGRGTHTLLSPATEQPIATIAMGSAEDVDRAVAAAKRAFETYSRTSREERLVLLRRLLELYNESYDELAELMTREMGTTLAFSREAQAWVGRAHLETIISVLERFEFSEQRGDTLLTKEPVGVCALITPWNWPMNQIVVKVVPALAAGCTLILKPSEYSPLSSIRFTELVAEAGYPAGVFNYVQGEGAVVGEALSRHPDVDMVSITGSTRAGVAVAKAAADTVKRVHQELGGKSANIILDDADFETAVRKGVEACFGNCGQACRAPTRMLVPIDRMAEAARIAGERAAAYRVGDPSEEGVDLGPVVNRLQFERIQDLIRSGIEEGATLAAGGPGRPDDMSAGYYVKPTVFADVAPEMRISREEIFGPVLSIIGYRDEEDAIRIANESIYGLSAYVQSGSIERARRVANRMRAGNVYINYADWDAAAPFGGFKQSGNGREHGEFGLTDFLEIKATAGYGA
ncbi:aldehyde dehydrogenase family protein [Aureimonas sp. AU4]|uniref:aldehyde dehydrogenase family protein n=1 Tax=Aureimonas sp. AU4 TaxID=1638163 RepID=UPI0007816332|nr:aldehyde dehydrogenase family protein [Aureimonas sp. AU4]